MASRILFPRANVNAPDGLFLKLLPTSLPEAAIRAVILASNTCSKFHVPGLSDSARLSNEKRNDHKIPGISPLVSASHIQLRLRSDFLCKNAERITKTLQVAEE
ncbi:MAG TPA: hypothetical protein VF762_12875 [Blastocatellia bacterium]